MKAPPTATAFRSMENLLPSPRALQRVFHTLLPSGIRMFGAGIQFLSTVIVARVLGDGPSAGFFFWSSVLMTSGPIATYGLEQIALRNVPRLQRDGRNDEIGPFVAGLRSLSLLVSLLIGLGWVVYAIVTQPEPGGFRIWNILPPLALASIAITLINGEALKGLSRPVAGTIYGHLLPVSLFCVLVALFAEHLNSPGILTLYTGSYLAGALAARFAPGGNFRARYFSWPGKEKMGELIRDGFSICCVSLFGALGFIVPLAIMEMTRPAAEVSHLTTAFRIGILFIVLGSAIHSVFAPALSRSAELPNPFFPVFKVHGKAIAITLAALGLPLGIGITFPEPVMLVFGESFRDGAESLRLLLIVQLLSLCLGPVPYLLLMTGHTAFLARIGVAKFAAATVLSLLLIPRFGGSGMVAAMGIAFLGEGLIGIAYAMVKLRAQTSRTEDEG